jgi:hypothetical protein
VYSSNPREGGYIEIAIHGPLWAVQGHMGHSHIYTLTLSSHKVAISKQLIFKGISILPTGYSILEGIFFAWAIRN